MIDGQEWSEDSERSGLAGVMKTTIGSTVTAAEEIESVKD